MEDPGSSTGHSFPDIQCSLSELSFLTGDKTLNLWLGLAVLMICCPVANFKWLVVMHRHTKLSTRALAQLTLLLFPALDTLSCLFSFSIEPEASQEQGLPVSQQRGT